MFPVWINLQARVLSFHFAQGFEKLEFPSMDELMLFARKMSRQGYRIQ